MKYFSIKTLFKYSWDQVVAGYWQRYPNPKSGHVLSEDVVEREVVGHKLISKRLICKTDRVSKLAGKFLRGQNPYAYIIEESVLDLRTKEFVTYTRNINKLDISRVDEKCIYSPDPENHEQTYCDRQAWITSPMRGFSNVITSVVFLKMKKNSQNTIIGFEHVLKKLYIGDISEEPVVKDSIKDRAKEYAKSKAESVKSKAENMKSKAETMKSKVHLPVKTACETPLGTKTET